MVQRPMDLVALIERNADDLTRSWLRIVRSHPGTPTYHRHDEQELYQRAYRVYSQLGKWISRQTTKKDIAAQYTALGAERRREGFEISEIIHALLVARRVLWFKVQAEGFLDTALDLNRALDLYNRVLLFFDRATYFAAVGYEQERHRT